MTSSGDSKFSLAKLPENVWHFRIVMDSLFLETDDIRLQSQIWSRWPPSTERGFPWIFENCTNWRFFTDSKWFVTKFWSRCWLVSLSSAGYIWIIQELLDVPFWGFQWISNITNTDGCWTSYRIVVGWWDDISLPLSSLHSLWLETRLNRQNMYFLCFKSQKVDVWIIFLNGSAPIFDDWFGRPNEMIPGVFSAFFYRKWTQTIADRMEGFFKPEPEP